MFFLGVILSVFSGCRPSRALGGGLKLSVFRHRNGLGGCSYFSLTLPRESVPRPDRNQIRRERIILFLFSVDFASLIKKNCTALSGPKSKTECAFRAPMAAHVLMLQKGSWSYLYFMLFCYLFVLNKHWRFLKAGREETHGGRAHLSLQNVQSRFIIWLFLMS